MNAPTTFGQETAGEGIAERLVVIGNGMAGCRAVEEILARDPGRFTVTIFGAEPRVNYNRIMLSPVLAGEKTFDEIVINSTEWYAENGVELIAAPGDRKKELGQLSGRIMKNNMSLFGGGSDNTTDRAKAEWIVVPFFVGSNIVWALTGAAGLHSILDVEIDGHVGYYCAGMNKLATVLVRGNASTGIAENMMSGKVWVKGDASQAAGATGRGGLLVMKEVAEGKAAFGFTQTSEIKAVPGVKVAGYLPDQFQLVTVYAGAMAQGTAEPAAARPVANSTATTTDAATANPIVRP